MQAAPLAFFRLPRRSQRLGYGGFARCGFWRNVCEQLFCLARDKLQDKLQKEGGRADRR